MVMGGAVAGVWTRDIIRADQLEISAGRLRARDPQAETLMLPHWIAEYATAALLVVAAGGLWADADWGEPLALVALGALIYTSINSLGWALADRVRRPYAIPMTVGAVGGLAAVIGLFVT